MSKKSKSIIEIIKSKNDIEVLINIGDKLPHLQNVIHKKIMQLSTTKPNS